MDLRNVTTISMYCSIIRKTVLLIVVCLTMFIGSIMFLSWAFAGPPSSCGGSGIWKIIDDTHNSGTDHAYLIVCNNGTSYTR